MLERGNISHNHKLSVFTVVGTTGNPHVVTLFPTEKCTCASTTHCYHILAARLSIGLEDGKSKRKINLTQLKRNTRSKRDKKSGRKAPRAGDYEITPAPDANTSDIPPSLDTPPPLGNQSTSLDTQNVPLSSDIPPLDKSKCKINLKGNTRSKRDKKSGRKAPRAGDYEITPAPDANTSDIPPSLDTPPPLGNQSTSQNVPLSSDIPPLDKSKCKINLKGNTRSKCDKKSGRKAPHAGNYEITPATDADIPSQNISPSLDAALPWGSQMDTQNIPSLSPLDSQSSHLDTRSGHSFFLDSDSTDSEVLMSQLFDSSLLRLWRTGGLTHMYTSAEDEEVDVSGGYPAL